MDVSQLADIEFCYLTTTGRVSGRQHTIEIWFVARGTTIFLMAGDHGSDWVKNSRKAPQVTIRIADQLFAAQLREPTDAEQREIRPLMLAKYHDKDDDLDEWGRTALLVAYEVTDRIP
jgi:deazaflavin-dependent oxidoreductase (nitroreductase family)